MRCTAIAIGLIFLIACRTDALCIYKGKMYAKTTVAEEFFDSKWVARVQLIAADNHSSDEDESWTLYHLQVITSYKGNLPNRFDVFTYRDSGGFYLDKGMNPDLGGQYLLFLDSIGLREKVPTAARQAVIVNYNCGQSKNWANVSTANKAEVLHLSTGH